MNSASRLPLLGTAALAALLVLAPAAAPAQTPVVQPLPGQGAPSLSQALLRLGRDPRDVSALIDAGNAALAMGDTDAAIGFFTRADKLQPNSAPIQAGLAGAKVRAEDPFAAIPLFQAAEKSGPIPPALLADRGLAYDLVGDNAAAQGYYRQAISGGAGPDAIRRLALSQAIAGDRRGAEGTLAPLLEKQDRAAWRTRAFVLAILGREDEAVSVVRATMPAEIATGISPYLRYMRQLTPAQQAAAANLGHFPRAAEIGRDDPRIAQFAPPRPTRLAAADTPLVPTGQPLGTTQGKGRNARSTAAAATPAAAPPPEPTRIGRSTSELPPVLAPTPQPAPTRVRTLPTTLGSAAPATPAPTRTVQAPAPTPAPARTALATSAEANRFDLARTRPATPAPAPAPAPVPAPTQLIPATPQPSPQPQAYTPAPAAPAPQPTQLAVATPPAVSPPAAPAPTPAPPRPAAKPSFADAFAELAPSRVAPVVLRGNAVDIRKITPAKPAPPPPPPPPPNPSRIWVQVGVGRVPARLEYDWRKFVKDDPALFRSHKAWVSDWGRTNRLLVGPFETEKAADAFTEKARKAGYEDAFVWTSPAGQVVDPL